MLPCPGDPMTIARLTSVRPLGEHREPAEGVKPARQAAPTVDKWHCIGAMKELLRTNDPVRLSWAEALLAAAGIEAVVLDTHTSIIEGSIGAIPRRLMVADADHRRAEKLLTEAGEPA